MPEPKFKVAKNNEAGDNWLICWTGADDDDNSYHVVTNSINASRLYQFSGGAKVDAELIAKLLNWYYDNLSLAMVATNEYRVDAAVSEVTGDKP